MKALYERWTAISLPKRILGGMIIGAVLGMVFRRQSESQSLEIYLSTH